MHDNGTENEIKNNIIDCIASESSIYRICDKVFQILEKQCTPAVLEFFLREMDLLGSGRYHLDENEKGLVNEQMNRYGRVWGEIMSALLSERLECEAFYAKLWNSISSTPLFETREAKVCILYLTCMNMCIPYYTFQGAKRIEDEKYDEYVDELKNEIIKARSLIFQPCWQYTERADALLKMLEQWEGREKRTVFLTQVIQLFELRVKLRDETPDAFYS